jgi:SAM-dependent methyltransferase
MLERFSNPPIKKRFKLYQRTSRRKGAAAKFDFYLRERLPMRQPPTIKTLGLLKMTDWQKIRHQDRKNKMQQVSHALTLAARRSPLSPVLKGLLRQPSPMAPALKLGRREGWEKSAEWLLFGYGESVLQHQHFLESLKGDINRDIEVELLLTAVRKVVLRRSGDLLRNMVVQEFVCAIVQQCMNNEYVWFVSEEEEKQVNAMLASSTPTLLAAPDEWQKLLVLALYRPLHELLGLNSESVFRDEKVLGKLPESLRVLVQNYIESYDEETKLKRSIQSFGTINDQVSRVVAAMYENYPYPRWINLVKQTSGSRGERLKTFFESHELSFLNRRFDVLVPGCGTGRKAIQIAMGFGNRAQVLATDLSRASLAYAARMAGKYQVRNIRFLQMDILDLPKLEQQFDVVECTGVLVCVADPLKAWRTLVDQTRSSGIIHISLYSELARREIVRLRKEYEDRITAIDTDYIRAYRRRLMQERPDTIDALPTRCDFFDLSRCKDLLFHPVEHRFTIPQISQYVAELGLEFRGFELPKLLQNRYWTAFPPASQRRNFDRWQKFEQKYPDAFQDLYEIWCKKPPLEQKTKTGEVH